MKVKGPPTKRTQTEEKKERDPLADDSDADVDAGSDCWPSSVGSGEESDPPATPSSKKGRGCPSSSKKATTPKSRGRLPWCSSDTDNETQGRGGISYTEDELAAMYETAKEDQ